MKGCQLPMKTFFIKFLASFFLIALFQIDGCKGCLEKERIGLLKIKSFFTSASDKDYADDILTSWVDDPMSDCCSWDRVQCSATTRQVMELSLHQIWHIHSDNYVNAYANLDFSLFLLFQELQRLDLSENYFDGWDDNKANYDSLGSLKQLKVLNLGHNYFNDSVLPYLSTLTSLTTLILRFNRIKDLTPNQGLEHLINLEELDLRGNTISGLQGLANLTKLKILDLSANNINGSTAGLELSNLRNLEVLHLSSNRISEIGLTNLTKLKVLHLRDNEIKGSLKALGLSKLKNLRALDLSWNNINSSLENQGICELQNLIELDLSENNFRSDLPRCLNNLTFLKLLDISSCQLSGNLPSVIANLTLLEYLDLSFNNFEGTFSLSSLANHSNLKVLLLSTRNNMLQVKAERYCLPTFQLKVLHLRNCNLNRNIYSFLLQQHDLKYLDLSHNKLVGDFPTWLLENNTKLEVLVLRNNSFTKMLQLPSSKHSLGHLDISINNIIGKLPQKMGIILPKLVYIDMSENSFEGNIPSSLGEMKELRLLDLSKNNFSGELSRPLVTDCISLKLLDLSNNNFYGQIFPKYMNLTQLHWLHLDDNNFGGKIDDGLQISTELVGLDISNNMLSGQIPHWVGNFSSSLWFLLMSKNCLEGNIPIQFNNGLLILDISRNRLSGSISSSSNISSIKHIYLQENALSGSIPNALFRSSKLMTLDLRDNKFFGRIPHQINEHSDLRVLLMGGNHLQGYIPNQLCQLRKLGILDLSRNRLNGSVPSCFTEVLFWKKRNGDLYGYKIRYSFSFGVVVSSSAYYNSSLKFTLDGETFAQIDEGVQVEFVTKNRHEFYGSSILNYMSGLDLSCNELTGEIPSEIGELEEIRALNFSHNSLSGPIPKSFSNLAMIESLDLSHNKLSGQIPLQLTEINFLSTFDVSYNYLSGPIPDKGQFATFDANSYKGNLGLCGETINKSCSSTVEKIPIPTSTGGEEDESAIDMESFIWSFAISFVTFILGLFAILRVNTHWRRLWFFFIEACIDCCYYWLFKCVYFVLNNVRR